MAENTTPESTAQTEDAATKAAPAKEKPSKERIAKEFENAILGTTSTDVVDHVFEEVKKLGVPVSNYAIDSFEKNAIKELSNSIDGMREAVSTSKNLAMFETDEWVDKLQTTFQAVLQIANVKGDKAEPFTRALVDECIKLSDEEYFHGSKLMVALVNAYDTAFPETVPAAQKAAAPKAKVNPFKAPKP